MSTSAAKISQCESCHHHGKGCLLGRFVILVLVYVPVVMLEIISAACLHCNSRAFNVGSTCGDVLPLSSARVSLICLSFLVM